MTANLNGILKAAVANGDVAHAAAIVTDGKDIRFEGHVGPRSLADPRPLGPETVYWVHSMTKPLTATGVMLLVEQGRLDLDADCASLLPAFKNIQVLEGFAADGTPTLRPAKTPITLRRLLTHTSGLVYDTWNFNQLRWISERNVNRYDLFNDPAKLPPLGYEPGERWEYGIGIDMAGKAIEAVTGQTLEAYLREAVLRPLGMADTGYVTTADIRERLSGVHKRGTEGDITVQELTPPIAPDPASFTGGGGMFSTARDYVRFMDMILNDGQSDGQTFLKPETVREMARNHIGNLRVTGLPSAVPHLSYPFDLYPETPKGWGLSFMINLEDIQGRRAAGSLAWAGLRNTYFWIDRTSGLAGALFTQLLPFADPKTLALLDEFEAGVYVAFAKR